MINDGKQGLPTAVVKSKCNMFCFFSKKNINIGKADGFSPKFALLT